MYDRQWYGELRTQLQELDEAQELKDQHTLLLQVELGLFLLEQLGLADEPAQVVWVILSGLPLPTLRQRLNATQVLQLARARLYLPFTGRFAWENALSVYRKMAVRWRAYDVVGRRIRRTDRHQNRFATYARCLDTPVPRQPQRLRLAQGNERLEFEARMPKKTQIVRFTMPEEIAALGAVEIPWFTTARERKPMTIDFSEVVDAAQRMDRREDAQGMSPSAWLSRLDNLRYRTYENGQLGPVNANPLVIDGQANIAGMVSSGKTNLMKILAFHMAKKQQRVTLVVGDTMTALDLVDYYNRLFDAPEDCPVAVPLIGQSMREHHVQRFAATQQFTARPDHRAQRWLSTDCPLQGLLTPAQLPDPLVPGKEPCQRLAVVRDEDAPASTTQRACPLFAGCPSKVLFRDLPHALIWITTPGALGAARVPSQVGTERLKYWELIYDQSDVVIFDEVDAVQAWFDAACAPQVILTNRTGLLDRVDPRIANALAQQRAQPPNRLRWVTAARKVTDVVGLSLSELSQSGILERWLERKYFTARSLFFSLTYLLFELRFDPQAIDESDEDTLEALIPKPLRPSVRKVLGYFNAILDNNPDQRAQRATPAVAALIEMMRDIRADNRLDLEACSRWLQAYIPNLGQRLAAPPPTAANTRRPRRPPIRETLDTLSLKLGLALCVTILDRNLSVMFDEWQNSVVSGQAEERMQGIPEDFDGLIPLPPTGRLFGFYHRIDAATEGAPGDGTNERNQGLVIFEYGAVGRWFVMNFHRLLADVEDRPGPNVLALSGTSWLPDSSRWHFASPPQGVLEPDDDARRAIAQSVFRFLPLQIREGGVTKSLAVSGSGAIDIRARDAGRLLALGEPSPLQEELRLLTELGQQDARWRDRRRILVMVNSYDQADLVAREISSIPGWRGQVFGLKRGEGGEDQWVDAARWYEPYDRGSIERFSQTGGTILVAPMQAIGRGYNILNDDNIAAFGAIYFLTRPMHHPFDLQGFACEVNRQALLWCDNPRHPLWRSKSLYKQGLALRRRAHGWWSATAQRKGYQSLPEDLKRDLAATMAGQIIQACGRLLRGGVPFHAFFVDAKWAPRSAGIGNKKGRDADTPTESLLAAMVAVLDEYIRDPIGKSLYQPLAAALRDTKDATLVPFWRSAQRGSTSRPRRTR